MPVLYLRRLTGKERSRTANLQLAHFLAFIAGAANAGGFLAVHQYTSHMSGVVASIADNLALGEMKALATGVAALVSFLAGAATTAVLVNWGRRRDLESLYALPLLFEAGLMLCFGCMGTWHFAQHRLPLVPATIVLLCFMMGLQNAMITKLSNAEIRTTHVTGMVTDIGIELGRLMYWNRSRGSEMPPVRGDLQKLWLLFSLVGLFFTGGVLGAITFQRIGFLATLPLALVLLMMAAVPVMDDLLDRANRTA